jgi:hypothetical protein
MFATYREKIGINRDINSDHLLRVLEVNAQRLALLKRKQWEKESQEIISRITGSPQLWLLS